MIAQLSKEYIFTKPSKIFPRLLSYFFYEGRPATTKGKWFNPITFYALRSSLKGKIVSASESPIFITGTGRSGSTLLGMVLSVHADVGFLNEPKALWYVANPLDDIIGSYSSGKSEYIPKAGYDRQDTAKKVKSIYSSYLIKTNSNRIVDKYPEMIFRIDFLNTIFNNPKYIFLVRNPWDTIVSTASWSTQNGNKFGKENWWGVENRKWKLLVEQVVPSDPSLAMHKQLVAELHDHTNMAAVEWITTMNFGLQMIEKYPDKIHQVKYEDLCSQPDKMLQHIFEFAGLSPDDSCINYARKIMHLSPLKSKPEIHPLLEEAIIALCKKLNYRN